MSQRFRRVRDLFEASLEVAAAERSEWLREACDGDSELEREVSALLQANQQTGFLDQPILPHVETSPRQLGPYEILEEIGHGGMGTVYRAVRVDDAFRKVVAVKVIGGAGLRLGLAARFQRERQILAKLEHPNIARILDGGTEGGVAYLVMEYVEGERIDVYCESHQLTIRGRLDLFSQLCAAADYAHRNLIVHRDIKPGNVMVTADGVVKLLDFGIAKILDPEDDGSLTQTVQMTPDYASPEQIRGEAVTPASDVYAIGVMLYQLLTGGALPRRTTGVSLAELMRAVSEQEPPPPSTKAPDAFRDELRGDLDCIVLAALASDAQRRYASAGRLADDLARFRDGHPVWAHADSAAYRARKFVTRHWVLLSATAIVILTLALGVAITTRQAQIARVEKEAAEHARLGEQQQRVRAEQALEAARAAQQRAQQQSDEATRQRGLAETRYQDVRSLATTVLFDIYDQIRALAGASEARRVAVTKALQYLDSLSKQSQEDSALQAELAAAYQRAGDILGNMADSAVEGTRASLPLYQKALGLRKKVAEGKPMDRSQREALAKAYELVGVGHLGLGQSAEARASFETAMRLFGDNPIFRIEMLDRLGTAYGMLSDFDKAIRHCRE